MKIFLINIAVLFGGLIIGMIVNMNIIMVGSRLIMPPEGMDIMDAESIKAHLHLFEMRHFVFPFLAHAGGTLAGAVIVARFVKTHSFVFAMIVGGFFLLGGIMNAKLIPAPLFYNILDIGLCYIPMGYLGWTLGHTE